jgi:hypothetical protein
MPDTWGLTLSLVPAARQPLPVMPGDSAALHVPAIWAGASDLSICSNFSSDEALYAALVDARSCELASSSHLPSLPSVVAPIIGQAPAFAETDVRQRLRPIPSHCCMHWKDEKVGCASMILFLSASSLFESWRFAFERSEDALSQMPQEMQIMSPADVGESFSDDEPETAIDLSLQVIPSLVLVQDSFDLPEILELGFHVQDPLLSDNNNVSLSEEAADAMAHMRAPSFASATMCEGHVLSVPEQALAHDVHSQRSVSEVCDPLGVTNWHTESSLRHGMKL